MHWLEPAFRTFPDTEGLNHSGHTKFKSIDVKLGVAMTAMLNASGDQAADLYLDVNRKANHCVRSLSGKIINGRHIIAMSYESCRTRDRLDMLVTLEYLIKSQYQGDSKMNVFKQMWPEVISRMPYASGRCTIRHAPT